MNYIILKSIKSKETGIIYYKIGIRVYKNGVKVFWSFISYPLFKKYFDLYDVNKCIDTEYVITYFCTLKECYFERKEKTS